jgi:predicted Na+-dependent transporter
MRVLCISRICQVGTPNRSKNNSILFYSEKEALMAEFVELLYDLMSLIFVLSTMVSMGLSLTIAQVLEPLRNTRFVIMALLASFVVVPVVAVLLTQLIPMDEALNIGLVLVALAAGAPALPKLADIAGVDTAAGVGLMVLLIVATIIVMPIVLPLVLTGVTVTFWDIASGLVVLMLIPLAVSLLVRARYETLAQSVQPGIAQASTFSLILLIVLMLVINFNDVVSLFGSGGLLASIILVIVALGSGYLLGGSDPSIRWVQVLGAGQRNIAAAMVVATLNFGDSPNVIVMIVVFAVITMVVMTPLAAELGKRNRADRHDETDATVDPVAEA